jgi:hypothetical protein
MSGPRQITQEESDTWDRRYHGTGTPIHRLAWWAGMLHQRFIGGSHTLPMLLRFQLQRARRAWRSGFRSGTVDGWQNRRNRHVRENAGNADGRTEAPSQKVA